MSYDGVILAGGGGRRLGGTAKPSILVGSRSMLDIAVTALADAALTVAVGPVAPTPKPVRWTREQPSGGGPVAGLAAALPMLGSAYVVVLAADLPFVTAAAVEQLVLAAQEAGGAMAVDAGRRDQPLVACYRLATLSSAMPAEPRGVPMRALVRELEARVEIARIDLGGDPPVVWDCDTADDIDRAREMA